MLPWNSLINKLDNSRNIAKILQTCYDWTCPPNLILSTCRKSLMFIFMKKSNFAFISISFFSSLLLWVLWIGLNKSIKTNRTNLLETLMFTCNLNPFLLSWDIKLRRILQSNWLRAFWLITWEPESCKTRGLQWNINNNMIFYFRLFPGKSYDKTPFVAHFSSFQGN